MELHVSSPFSSQLRENRGASLRCTPLPTDQLRPTTNSDKLSVKGCKVRHPPPSGWLDEPGRLKGGGVPSPSSNSLKPTIIVTGILVTDRRFDVFQLKANRGDCRATRPHVRARALASMAPTQTGDGHRTFALEKPNDQCHGRRGRNLEA